MANLLHLETKALAVKRSGWHGSPGITRIVGRGPDTFSGNVRTLAINLE
jgi:hypothetical protein